MPTSSLPKPKLCVNAGCRVIMYVAPHRMHLPLQCPACIEERYRERTTETDVQDRASETR